jgi:argininosuccinate lyase
VSLVAAAMAEATFDVEKLAARAGENWITITELADTLVREHGLPFKAGHTIAARLVAGPRATPERSISTLVREIAKDVTGKDIVYTDAQLAQILSPRHFVEVRKTHGGPSPSETARATAVSKNTLASDDEWLLAARDRLRTAESDLEKAASALV